MLQNKIKKDKELFSNDLYVSSILNEEFSAIDTIYIDLQYLQDFYLGALLNMYPGDTNYKYILSKLNDYNNRLIETSISNIYTDLHVTEEQVSDYIYNLDNHDYLIKVSPYTSFIKLLPLIHKNVLVQNRITENNGKPYIIKYIFNLYPLCINEDTKLLLKHRILFFLQDTDTNVDIEFINRPIEKMSFEFYANIDYMFAYNFNDLIKETEPNTKGFIAFYIKMLFLHKTIFAPFRISNKKTLDKLDFITGEQLLQVIKDTTKYLSINCKFSYLNPDILN